MTASPSGGRWYRHQSAALLLALLGLVIIAALVAPLAVDPPGATSYSAGPGGVRLLHDVAARLGWRVERREFPLDQRTARGVVHLVINPTQYLAEREAGALLARVRAGDGLVVVGSRTVLADSLGYRAGEPALRAADAPPCRTTRYPPTASLGLPRTVVFRRPVASPDQVVFGLGTTSHPVLVGYPLGAGRVVIAADPDVLSNRVVGECANGVAIAAMRMLTYAAGDGARHLVLDEYHHGYGATETSVAGMARALLALPSGRTFAQLLAAGLVLLIAVAPRAVPPVDPRRIPRRSPLEQVGALAAAYDRIGATRTATAQLVGGLRRRAGHRVRLASGSDEHFLKAIAARSPDVGKDVDLVLDMLAGHGDANRFAAVGPALTRLEAALAAPPSRSLSAP